MTKTKDEILSLLKGVANSRDCVPSMIGILRDNIQRKEYVNHANNQYISIWDQVGQSFAGSDRLNEAILIFETLYEELTMSQIENGCYIPKGLPLVWMRDYCLKLNKPWLAQKYIILTIIEDAIANKGNINLDSTGSYFRAVWYQNIKDAQFKDIASKAYSCFKTNNNFGRFPEWVLLNISNEISITTPSDNEINNFVINAPFAKYWFDTICNSKKKNGTDLEDFCAFLLMGMPGFEVKRRISTRDYHYDILIRNKSFAKDFRQDFGNYIAAECKNWSKMIGVQEIAYFTSKLVFQDIKSGIIFSQKGLSGKGEYKEATLTVLKSFYKTGNIIMIINKKDIYETIKNRNFINILQTKYEEARFSL